jgi:hypothetical protein
LVYVLDVLLVLREGFLVAESGASVYRCGLLTQQNPAPA